jgi:hypothetical protein
MSEYTKGGLLGFMTAVIFAVIHIVFMPQLSQDIGMLAVYYLLCGGVTALVMRWYDNRRQL